MRYVFFQREKLFYESFSLKTQIGHRARAGSHQFVSIPQ